MQRYVAEALATFALVFAGTAAIVIDQAGGGSTHLGVSVVFGVVVMVMIYAVGDVSGAHLNPAVTLAFAAAGRFPRREILPFVASQLAGALTASVAVRLLFSGGGVLGATLPTGGVPQALFMEVILTCVLMFVILGVSTGAKEKGLYAGIAVGGAVALGALVGGPVSGASMNPARSLGPALVSGELAGLWIYLTAPVAGALLAVVGCRSIRPDGCCASGVQEGASC